ncbi:MAG TPA: SH3 domain-containing protein [Anaerolineales bacterium]|nr:SH3 domain-containing protein [Anaerolineales bacterium]
MAPIRRNLFAYGFLLLAMLACNVATATPPAIAPEIQTAVAQTLQAALTPAITSTRLHSPVPATVSATGVLTTVTTTATITPTYSVPVLTVEEPTNCRTGPGEDYEVVFTYLAGKKLEIAGRYEPGDFWLVNSSESPGGTCWLWGEYVEVVGSYWTVPSVTPPPTATNPPPQAPAIQRYEFFCSSLTGQMEITIAWTDRAANEMGYRIIRNGELVVTLPPDSSTYTDTIDLATGESAAYRVEVFSSFGAASSSTINITC